MSRKLITGLVAAVAMAGMGFAAGSALSGTNDPEPHYTPLTIDLSKDGAATRAKAGATGSGKPKLVYLSSSTPTTINPAPIGSPPDPATGAPAVGRYVDLKLAGCSKVVDGGAVPLTTNDVYVQGSYVQSSSKYHVLIGLDDTAADGTFQIDTNLTCLKGVK